MGRTHLTPPNCSDIIIFDLADGSSGLRVASVQSVDARVKDNARAHHTDRFELVQREEDPRLVVRRGQAFTLSLGLSRAFDSSTDAISFIFTFAGNNFKLIYVSNFLKMN